MDGILQKYAGVLGYTYDACPEMLGQRFNGVEVVHAFRSASLLDSIVIVRRILVRFDVRNGRLLQRLIKWIRRHSVAGFPLSL
jgi:hypothetical protein